MIVDTETGEVTSGTVPFAEGNLIPLVHGASNNPGAPNKILSTKAADVAEALIGTYPWVLETDVVAIEQYCRAEARSRLLHEHAMEVAEHKGIEAVPAYIWAECSKAENNAGRFAEQLGLTPMGRLKIAKDAGFAQHFQGERLRELIDNGRALRESQGRAS